MKKYLFLIMILLSTASISADNYNEYLEASRKHLAGGNKEKAESCYRISTTMTGTKDAELEKAFSSKAQSGNVESKTINYPDGGRYEGEVKDGKRHGKGTLFWTDGGRYEGEWQNDKRNGQGTHYYADGHKYVGQWKDNYKHGQGTYYFTNPRKKLYFFFKRGKVSKNFRKEKLIFNT